MAGTVSGVFGVAAGRDGGRPFVTYYDDASGERVELSYATTANWVAKTANLLTDELELRPEETVAIRLPTHWLGIVWALSTWTAGGALTSGRGDIAFVGPTVTERGERETVATALLPLGGRFKDPLPAGVIDYGGEVYNHPDVFEPWDPPAPDWPAYDLRTHADLLAAAEPIARRVLTTANLVEPDRIETLVGILAGGGSLVLCRNLDPDRLDRRITDERVDEVHDAAV
jgi:uncharacterized protein (TIGR03089 family)